MSLLTWQVMAISASIALRLLLFSIRCSTSFVIIDLGSCARWLVEGCVVFCASHNHIVCFLPLSTAARKTIRIRRGSRNRHRSYRI